MCLLVGESSVSSNRRRSNRGSYHIGFYSEGEQQLFAAFRDHTSELKSPGESPLNSTTSSSTAQRVVTNPPRRTSSPPTRRKAKRGHNSKHLSASCRKRILVSPRVTERKMTERKPSWNNNELKTFCKVKEDLNADAELSSTPTNSSSLSVSSKQRVSRRHTLPGRAEIPPQDMGVALTKCGTTSASPQSPQGNHCDTLGVALDAALDLSSSSSDPKPSTSGVAAALDDDGLMSSSASTMLHHLMRRLPRKKKSVSEQDLSHVEPPSSGATTLQVPPDLKKVDKISSSFLKKHQEVKRRKSANVDCQDKVENVLIEKGFVQLNGSYIDFVINFNILLLFSFFPSFIFCNMKIGGLRVTYWHFAVVFRLLRAPYESLLLLLIN